MNKIKNRNPAVPLYILIFTFYHYLNLLAGMESKKEFFGMLPAHAVIAAILSLAFFLTKSILYSLLIHNLFDTLNYIGVIAGLKGRKFV